MINIIFLFLSIFNTVDKKNLEQNLSFVELQNIDYCFINGELAYYSKLINNNCEIKLYSISNSPKKYVIHINKELNNFNTCNKTLISNIVNYKDSIYLITSQKILKYFYNPLIDSIEFSNYIDLIEIFNRNILYYAQQIYLDYPYFYGIKSKFNSIKHDEESFYYFKINLKNYLDNKFYNIDYPDGFYWTIATPRNIIDFYNNHYLVSSVTNYEIKIFDINDNLINIIKRKPSFWKATTYKLEKFKNKHPVEIFNFIKDDSTTKTIIHRANFLDENRILICYSNEKEDSEKLFDFFFDLWEKRNNKWQLIENDIDIEILKEKFGIEINASYNIFDNKLLITEFDELNKLFELFILKK